MKSFKLPLLKCQIILLVSAQLISLSFSDIGTASFYGPPYIPTACPNIDLNQFQSTEFFAAAGEGIWDNGASCGRLYDLRCISAAVPRPCIPGQMIQVRIIDRALTMISAPSRNGTTMVLTKTAFDTIANPTEWINIEFKEA